MEARTARTVVFGALTACILLATPVSAQLPFGFGLDVGQSSLRAVDNLDASVSPGFFADLYFKRWLALGVSGRWESYECHALPRCEGGGEMTLRNIQPKVVLRPRPGQRADPWIALGFSMTDIDFDGQGGGTFSNEFYGSGNGQALSVGLDLDVAGGVRIGPFVEFRRMRIPPDRTPEAGLLPVDRIEDVLGPDRWTGTRIDLQAYVFGVRIGFGPTGVLSPERKSTATAR